MSSPCQAYQIANGTSSTGHRGSHRGQSRRGGFTLVELLVVIGIIALLIAMLLPSLSKARNTAVSVACMSNLRQVYLLTAIYMNENQGYIPVPTWKTGDPAAEDDLKIWYNVIPKYLNMAPMGVGGRIAALDLTATGGIPTAIPLLHCPALNGIVQQRRTYAMNKNLTEDGFVPDCFSWVNHPMKASVNDGSRNYPIKLDWLRKVQINCSSQNMGTFADVPMYIDGYQRPDDSGATSFTPYRWMNVFIFEWPYSFKPMAMPHQGVSVVFLDGHTGHVQTTHATTLDQPYIANTTDFNCLTQCGYWPMQNQVLGGWAW